jgi:cytoskeletal protein RodZ
MTKLSLKKKKEARNKTSPLLRKVMGYAAGRLLQLSMWEVRKYPFQHAPHQHEKTKKYEVQLQRVIPRRD